MPSRTGSRTRPEFTPYYEGFLGGRLFRWLDWAKLRLLRRRVVPSALSGRMLDLGCGSGAIAAALAAAEPTMRVVGLDHEISLARATRNRRLLSLVADFERMLPFADESFDVVAMIDTIEHAEDPLHVVREVHRILKPSGVFVVFTPPYDQVTWVLAEAMHRAVTRRRADHISPFTRESLSYLLGRVFPYSKVGYLNGGLSMWGMAWATPESNPASEVPK